jgi:hypothetical protein
MASMNHGRIVAGGLAAGFVMNVIDAVVNGILLAEKWDAEMTALNPAVAAQAASPVGWIIYDFAAGILLVWLYAAIRPRYGPGPGTALFAGFMIWLITHLAFSSFVFLGLFSLSLVAATGAGGLVAALAGGYVGGFLYRE